MKSIITKYLKGETTNLEEKELYNWLKKDKANVKIFKQEITFYMVSDSTDQKVDAQKAFEVFEKQIKNKESKHIHIYTYKKYLKYAAVLAIFISSAYLIKNEIILNAESNNVLTDSEVRNTLSNSIVLTKNDGTKQVLQEKQEEISYLRLNSEKTLTFNELKVPKGQIFRVILSDSTIVWLNADTKLKYPEIFIDSLKTRTVYLEGEAFFEVSHDKRKPFIVNTNGINVQVLGTKFNVSAYANDDQICTTLVEGSVNVIDDVNSNNSLIITPSFQASYQKQSKSLASREVNITDYTSWIEKRIIFNNVTFNELISKIERSYNVDIINENINLSEERFTGEFDIEDIETVFKALSVSYYFEYEIASNKITIK